MGEIEWELRCYEFKLKKREPEKSRRIKRYKSEGRLSMSRKPLLGRILVETESPEEFLRLAKVAGWTRALPHAKKQTFFVIDKSGYVY
jgi:hypothetical protein